MNLIEHFLTKNDCYNNGLFITPKGVMVHSTGANNTNVNRYVDIGNHSTLHWNRSGLTKCVHAFLGKLPDGSIGVCQTLPWDKRGWHAGGYANNTHISFEICEDNLKDPKYFELVYQEAVELTAYLCDMYYLDPLAKGVVICHQEGYRMGWASNHADVLHWFPKMGKSMDDFRMDVNRFMLTKKEEDDIMDMEKFYPLFKQALERYNQEMAENGYSKWAIKEGVPEFVEKTGMSDGTNPQLKPTREQVQAMIMRTFLYDSLK